MEYVDLLLIHWPNTEIPLSDSLPAMEKIRAASQARAIGVSNFPIALLKESVELHKATLLCDQVKWTLLTKVATSCDRILIAGGANVEAEWEQGPAV